MAGSQKCFGADGCVSKKSAGQTKSRTRGGELTQRYILLFLPRLLTRFFLLPAACQRG